MGADEFVGTLGPCQVAYLKGGTGVRVQGTGCSVVPPPNSIAGLHITDENSVS